MKPSSFSPQISLYSQVQEAKTASAFSPASVMSEEEGITKTSVREKLGKQLSPTKTIGALGGGLIGLTGLYMLGQKVHAFLFGEASSPSPASVPPTPVASEVLEDVPTPEKNVVQQATEWGKNTAEQGWKEHNEATDKVKETIVEVAQTIFEAPGKLVNTVESYIHGRMRGVQYYLERTQKSAQTAIVRVTTPVEKAYHWERSKAQQFKDFMENLLKKAGLDVFGNTNPHAESSVYHPTVEVMPPDAPPKPRGFLERAVITVNTTAQHIQESAEKALEGVTHEVTRITDTVLETPKKHIKAGKRRQAKAFTWLNEKLWKPIGLNVLEAENPHVETSHYPPLLEGAKDQGDNVIEVVAERIKETAKEASQGVTHQTRKMKNTATHMAIETAEYIPTTTTGSAGLDLFAMAMHALYGAGKKVSKRFKIFKP